jgi:hypothetical protein
LSYTKPLIPQLKIGFKSPVRDTSAHGVCCPAILALPVVKVLLGGVFSIGFENVSNPAFVVCTNRYFTSRRKNSEHLRA